MEIIADFLGWKIIKPGSAAELLVSRNDYPRIEIEQSELPRASGNSICINLKQSKNMGSVNGYMKVLKFYLIKIVDRINCSEIERQVLLCSKSHLGLGVLLFGADPSFLHFPDSYSVDEEKNDK